MLDRMDLCVETGLPDFHLFEQGGETSKQIRERVGQAYIRQKERYVNEPFSYNGELTGTALEKYCPLGKAERKYLELLFQDEQYSMRRITRIIKVSRTIADLAGSDRITEDHITEAIRFRSVDRKYWGVVE